MEPVADFQIPIAWSELRSVSFFIQFDHYLESVTVANHVLKILQIKYRAHNRIWLPKMAESKAISKP